MLAGKIVELPLGAEQDDFPLEAVGGDGALASKREPRVAAGEPSGRGEAGRLYRHVDVVLAPQPARDDVELQLPDDADNGLAASGLCVEHLHQPLFLELLQPFVVLLVPRVLQTRAAEVLRWKARDTVELQRLPGMHRVAD